MKSESNDGKTMTEKTHSARLHGTSDSELAAAVDACKGDPDKYFSLIRELWSCSGDWRKNDDGAIYLYLIDQVMDRAKEKLRPEDYHKLYTRVAGEYWMY